MSGFQGADTEALRDFSTTLQTGASRLEDMRSMLQSTIQSVEWVGSDAENFRDDFSHRVAGLFGQASDHLGSRRSDLERQAEDQDRTSGTGGSGSGDDGGFLDAIGELLANPLTSVLQTGNEIFGAGSSLWKMGKFISNIGKLGDAVGDVARAAAASKLYSDAAGFLGKLGPVGKFLGVAGGALSIYDGISNIIDPPHDGWRGVGDRIAGGLGVVGGAGGIALALGAGAMLGPVGVGVVLAAGVGSALWAAGNAIYDNWDNITGFVGDVGGHVSDFVSDAGDAIGEAGEAVGDAVGGAIDGVGDFVGGLF